MSDPLLPNNELVAKHWLLGLTAVPANKVATTLPEDPAVWADTGFVHIAGVVGGGSNMYYRLHSPVLQIDCYAVNLNSDKPAWNRANQLAQQIWEAAMYEEAQIKRDVVLPTGYSNARILEALPLGEPVKRPDAGSYAIYGFDLQLTWIPL